MAVFASAPFEEIAVDAVKFSGGLKSSPKGDYESTPERCNFQAYYSEVEGANVVVSMDDSTSAYGDWANIPLSDLPLADGYSKVTKIGAETHRVTYSKGWLETELIENALKPKRYAIMKFKISGDLKAIKKAIAVVGIPGEKYSLLDCEF
jgi:hypothetical protein